MVAHPREIEIKLAATPAMLEALRKHPQLTGEDCTATLVTTYFDTSGGRLRRGGAALRIRDDGRGREQTLKLASPQGAAVRRNEWNVAVAADLPEPSDFPKNARSSLARLLGGDPLEPVATTRIERTTRRLHSGSSAIEIAFDVGTVEAGGRTQALCEFEMELVEGHLADVIALALKLPLGPDLSWSITSKAERCHALAYDMLPAAAHAKPVKLSSAMNVARGFQAIAWNCLDQLLANYPLVIATGDPEGIHQARVAIRRLRAAGTLFGDLTGEGAGPVLRAELKAVASGLGRARDMHVLFERVAKAARGSDGDLDDMLAHLAEQRDKAVASAQAMLAAEPFQRLLFEFAEWLEAGDWLSRRGEAGGEQPLLPFASGVLSRRRRKLRRVRDRIADLPDAKRHRLRIDVKKLRYANAFFASLFTDRARTKHKAFFTKALGQLQDSLGDLNDMAVAAAGRGQLFADLEVIDAARQSAQLDGVLVAEEKSRRKLFKAAEKSLAVIVGTPAWWKVD